MRPSTVIAIIIVLVVVVGVLVSRGMFFDTDNTDEEASDFSGEVTFSAGGDGTEIVGNYVEADGEYAVILLHMMPATKESYDEFAKRLKDSGFSSIAIDLRGHGESEAGPDGYEDFSNKEHQASIQDVYAASGFLKQRGFDKRHQLLVGASIGANLALQFASENNEIKAVALLSPGFDYSGIVTKPLMENMADHQAVLIAASEDDQDRAQMARELLGLAPPEAKADPIIYEEAGHGTDMFGKESPGLETEIIRFFERSIQ